MTQSPPPLNYAIQPRSPRRFRSIVGWVLLILLAIMLFVLMQGKNRQSHRISVSDFEAHLLTGEIRAITVDGDDVWGDFFVPQRASDGTAVLNYRTTFPTGMTQSWPFMEHLIANRVSATV